jgi:hypothetical protein
MVESAIFDRGYYIIQAGETEVNMSIALSQVLNVALALAVIYYVMGLIVSAVTKLILETFETRGKVFQEFLKRNLLGALDNGKSELLERLKHTPQVSTLKPVRFSPPLIGFFSGGTKVSDVIERIPPKNLVDALFDLAGTFESGNAKVKAVLALLPDQLPGPGGPVDFAAKKELVRLADQGFENIEEMRAKMETWFTGLMEQSAMVFKAQARRVVIALSLALTLLLGVDSIELAQKYWKNTAVAATANAQAALILGSTNQENIDTVKVDELAAKLEELQAVDYRWYARPADAKDDWLLMKILGLLVTTLAVSQGSSFWYDLIKRIKGDQTEAAASTDAAEAAPFRHRK